MKSAYALRYPNEAFVAIDAGSNYPYETVYPGSVNFWLDPGAAKEYADRFKNLELQVVQVDFSISDVRFPTKDHFNMQAEAAEKMMKAIIYVPFCKKCNQEYVLYRDLGQIKCYRCNECRAEATVE